MAKRKDRFVYHLTEEEAEIIDRHRLEIQRDEYNAKRAAMPKCQLFAIREDVCRAPAKQFGFCISHYRMLVRDKEKVGTGYWKPEYEAKLAELFKEES